MIDIAVDDGRPQRYVLTARSEIVPAVLAVVARARLGLRCAHHDLSVFALSQSAVTTSLRHFLYANAQARVYLLMDETHWFDAQAARLKLLQRQFSHALLARRAHSDDSVGDQAVLLADAKHALLLGHPHSVGELWLNHEPHAQSLLAAFIRRWEAAAHNLPVTPLGL
ncbi:MAG: hypothetical protein RMK97_09880 [Sutterellaceae bacterium]|nr:hypothetical protein [Burkholderiaceae bacterium]MCX7901482.1 hypothetical protein [Burkholderiaceae bacterium]MDW8430789.1 hypothetical protein [Sutterellaceae bacterium]